MKSYLYMLKHCYKNEYNEEIKFIGLYLLRKDAVATIDDLKRRPGFIRYPKKCFIITKVDINKTNFTDGFTETDSEIRLI